MIQNPMRADDAQKKRSVMQRLVNWLTGRQGVDVTNHLFPPTYD